MVTHMKTTLEISDALFQEAKRLAVERHTTLRAVVELALRQFLRSEIQPGRDGFRLRKKTFRGQGLRPGLEEGNWVEIRTHIYEGRGG
jgi:Arc/MetJ family transcription regulator